MQLGFQSKLTEELLTVVASGINRDESAMAALPQERLCRQWHSRTGTRPASSNRLVWNGSDLVRKQLESASPRKTDGSFGTPHPQEDVRQN